MEINIRRAKPSDIGNLNRFQHELAEFEKKFTPAIKNMKNIEYYDLARLIKSPKILFLVAEVKKNLIGCCFGEIENKRGWQKYKQGGYIGLIFIKKEFRRNGIGKSLVHEVIRWFRSKRIRDIRLDVYCKNKAAIDSYKKIGFSNHIIEMVYKPYGGNI